MIRFDIAIFNSEAPRDFERSQQNLHILLQAMVAINLRYLTDFPPPTTPRLYASGVIYQREDGAEDWRDIPTILRFGNGDCEDLACYRCAELQYAGIAATPALKLVNDGLPAGRWGFHVLVRHPSGKIEDPSLSLGMAGPIIGRPMYLT